MPIIADQPWGEPIFGLAELLRTEARLAIVDGNVEHFLRANSDLLGLAELLGETPGMIWALIRATLVSTATGNIELALSVRDLSATQFAELDRRLAQLPRPVHLRQILLDERAMLLTTMDHLDWHTITNLSMDDEPGN
jgi:hypothetical protein